MGDAREISAQGEAASALALKFLVAGGFVTQAKADEALEIAAGYTHPAPRAAVDEAMVATRGAVVSAPTDVLAVCSECHEGAERLVCRRCVNDAQSCAVENELATQLRKTHMLFTGLDDCAVNVPEEWHEKPMLRFTGDHDVGDDSVGIGPRTAWVLAADQSGTVLGDMLARCAPNPEDDSDYYTAPRICEKASYNGKTFTVRAVRFKGIWHINEIHQKCVLGGRYGHGTRTAERRIFPTAKPNTTLTGFLSYLDCDLMGRCSGDLRAALTAALRPET